MNTIEEGAIAHEKEHKNNNGDIDIEKGRGSDEVESRATRTSSCS